MDQTRQLVNLMWPHQYVDRNVCKFRLYVYEHDQTLNQLSSEQTLSLSHSYMNSSAASLTHGLQYLPKRKAFSRNDRNMWLFRQRASNVDWVHITSAFLWKSHDETRLRREKSELHQQSETAFIHSHVWWHQGYMLTQHTEPQPLHGDTEEERRSLCCITEQDWCIVQHSVYCRLMGAEDVWSAFILLLYLLVSAGVFS